MTTFPPKPPHSRCRALRELLRSPRLEYLLEAHNGLSARIVEEAGFSGIWASGLALSAQYGVRDSNEASWTQVLEMVEFMADATTIPILLDGDTGYGNFNNMRRMVYKLENRNVAGVCIEDKVFPKTNSFIAGERQPLAAIDEFCGKIKAGKDAQMDADFCIVARVEALITGWGMDEALRRAEAYRAAGADAILIHSKLSRADEVLSFAREWANRAPLVIVPTKYYSTPTAVYRQTGISLVIWANHMLRAGAAAMQRLAAEVAQNGTVADSEDWIAPVSEIFRLQGADELKAAERLYAGAAGPTNAVILAASRGAGLEALTTDRPKAMLDVAGKPVLQRLVETLRRQRINAISVVAGYRSDAISVEGIERIDNPDYNETGELASLACAETRLGEDTVVLYGDLLFRSHILGDLLEAAGELVVVVDSMPRASEAGANHDPVWCSAPDEHAVFQQEVTLEHVGETGAVQGPPRGCWVGMLRVRGEGRRWINEALEELRSSPAFHRLGLPDLLNHLIAQGKTVRVLYTTGRWLNVNDMEDLRRAGDFAFGARP